MKSLGSVQTIVADAPTEEARVTTILHEASENETSLFVGRFLTEFSDPQIDPIVEQAPWIAVKQYGQGCWVNAQPPVADAYRTEIGLKDAHKAIESEQYETIVLSQVLGAVCDNLIAPREIEALVGACSPDQRLILTGDRLPEELARSVTRGQ